MMAIVSAPSPESQSAGASTAPYAAALMLLGVVLLIAAIRTITRHSK